MTTLSRDNKYHSQELLHNVHLSSACPQVIRSTNHSLDSLYNSAVIIEIVRRHLGTTRTRITVPLSDNVTQLINLTSDSVSLWNWAWEGLSNAAFDVALRCVWLWVLLLLLACVVVVVVDKCILQSHTLPLLPSTSTVALTHWPIE